jgi:hypothetical protein
VKFRLFVWPLFLYI